MEQEPDCDLPPNTDISVNGYTYKTDADGQVTRVNETLTPEVADRNTYQQGKAGRQGADGDEGGHIIASIFNGPGEMVNLYPQNANFNRGEWKALENTWKSELDAGRTVEVSIDLDYEGNATRPSGLNGTYTVAGGRPINFEFDNAPGGLNSAD